MEQILEYESLIYSIINKFSKRSDKDDLYQVGMIGLIEAFKNYDASYETKFSSYAYYYILGEVTKYIRESNCLKVSKELIKLNKSILKAKEIMEQRLGREPTNLEISLFLEVDLEKINEALSINNISSLDYQDEEGFDLYNVAPVVDKGMSAEILDLKDELMKLNSEERNIILARYFEEMTQLEASKKMGISQVSVSRQESKILQKLKSRL